MNNVIELVGKAVDVGGVLVIICGLLFTTLAFLTHGLRGRAERDAYKTYRRGIGRTLLLGLELLVAADIIRTVAIEPTIRSVSILGVIVLIRTFLSWSLEVELEGKWPWQARSDAEANASP